MTSSITASEYRVVTQILKSILQFTKCILCFTTDDLERLIKDLKRISDQIDDFIQCYKPALSTTPLRKSVMILNSQVETFIKENNTNDLNVKSKVSETESNVKGNPIEFTVTLKHIGGTLKEIVELMQGKDNHTLMDSQETVPPAGKEIGIQDLPDSVFFMIFSYLSLSECLRLGSVSSVVKQILDKPEGYHDRSLTITNRMFIKREEQPNPVNADYGTLVQFQPEVLQFLQGKGIKITKFVLRTPDAKEATIFMRLISSRITHLTFMFTEIVEALFADNQFWVEVLDSASLVYLNFQETKLSKMQVPVQIRDKIKEIHYPPFIYNAYACFDYNHPDPNSKEFFSFKAGEKFQILPSVRDLQGWKIAINEQGEKGFVPGNYLVLLDKK